MVARLLRVGRLISLHIIERRWTVLWPEHAAPLADAMDLRDHKGWGGRGRKCPIQLVECVAAATLPKAGVRAE